MDREALRIATYDWLKEDYTTSGTPTATNPQWSVDLINSYLEDGYNDFLCRTMYNITHTLYTTTAGTGYGVIPLDQSYNKIIRLECDGKQIDIVTPDQMINKLGADDWRAQTASSSTYSLETRIYAVFENYASSTALRLYPTPTTATAVDLYTIDHFTFASDTIEPSIPEVAQTGIVYYAVSQALKRLDEDSALQLSQFYYAQYLDYVRRYNIFNYTNINVPGTMNPLESLQPYLNQLKGG